MAAGIVADMRRLILFRHAKSDWDTDFASDLERPLAPRGIAAARAMGVALARAGEIPGLVLSSSAVRARTTAELAIEAGGWECPLEVTEALYMATISGVLGEVHRVDPAVERLMLVGHEPTWSALAGILTGGSHIAMKTASVAAIDFGIDTWRGASGGRGELMWLLSPALLTPRASDTP
jgi:phosphohistidine phosphatase